MLVLFFFSLFLLGVCFFGLGITLWGREIYKQFSGRRIVTCPETHRPVTVEFDALHAAVTELSGHEPDVRLADCTRWPMRADCGQECIPEALQVRPSQKPAISPSRMPHLAVLLAAFAAWILGVFWHSEYLFRDRWLQAVGMNQLQMRRVVEWWTPHLITVAGLVLFSYCIAALLAAIRRKGIRGGVIAALLVWFCLGLAALFVMDAVSRSLLWIEGGYMLLASLIIGGILGVWGGRRQTPAAPAAT
jgi:hypothetical protein